MENKEKLFNDYLTSEAINLLKKKNIKIDADRLDDIKLFIKNVKYAINNELNDLCKHVNHIDDEVVDTDNNENNLIDKKSIDKSKKIKKNLIIFSVICVSILVFFLLYLWLSSIVKAFGLFFILLFLVCEIASDIEMGIFSLHDPDDWDMF